MTCHFTHGRFLVDIITEAGWNNGIGALLTLYFIKIEIIVNEFHINKMGML